MTKQAVNGIANALAARLIFTGFALRSHSLQMSFREIAANLLAFFVLVPALIMLVVEGRTDFNTTERNIRTALIQDSGGTTQRLETWIQNRKANLLYLTEIAASRTPQQMQQDLEQAKQSSSNFLRLGLMDKDATATAYSPLLDERGQTISVKTSLIVSTFKSSEKLANLYSRKFSSAKRERLSLWSR